MFFLLLALLLFLLPGAAAGHGPQADIDSLVYRTHRRHIETTARIRELTYKVRSKFVIYFGYSPLNIQLIPFTEEFFADGRWRQPGINQLTITAKRRTRPRDSRMKAEPADTLFTVENLPDPMNTGFQLFDNEGAAERRRQRRAERKRRDGVSVTKTDTSLSVEAGINVEETFPFPFDSAGIHYYDFQFLGKAESASRRVYAVFVAPHNPDSAGVYGTVWIEPEEYNIIGFDFKYNEPAKVTEGKYGREDHTITAERSLYYGKYWLPDRIEEDFDLGIWGLKARAHWVVEFSGYEVNPGDAGQAIGDTLIFAIQPELEREFFPQGSEKNQLTPEEEEALIADIEDRLKSLKIFEEYGDVESIARKAAELRMQQSLGGKIKVISSAAQFISHNRVEGVGLHVERHLADLFGAGTVTSVGAGYGISDRRFQFESRWLKWFGENQHTLIQVEGYDAYGYHESRSLINPISNSLSSFVAKYDYHDYIRHKGGRFSLLHKLTPQAGIGFRLRGQKEISLSKETDFSLFHRSTPFRLNPPALDGTMYGGVSVI